MLYKGIGSLVTNSESEIHYESRVWVAIKPNQQTPGDIFSSLEFS